MDQYLKKYFSFPYEKNPLKIIAETIAKKSYSFDDRKFEPILTNNDRKITILLGKKFGFFILLLFSQIKIFFNKNSNNSYFDFFLNK